MPVSTFDPNTANGELWDEVLVEEFVTAINSRPKGVVGYAQITASSSSYSTLTDISGLSVTFTADSARRYKVTVEYMLLCSVSGDHGNIWLRDGSNNKLNVHTRYLPSSILGVGGSLVHHMTGVSGSQTVKVSVERAFGTGTVAIVANTIYPKFIMVEDLGLA